MKQGKSYHDRDVRQDVIQKPVQKKGSLGRHIAMGLCFVGVALSLLMPLQVGATEATPYEKHEGIDKGATIIHHNPDATFYLNHLTSVRKQYVDTVAFTTYTMKKGEWKENLPSKEQMELLKRIKEERGKVHIEKNIIFNRKR